MRAIPDTAERRFSVKTLADSTRRAARRVVVGVIGTTVLVAGVVMIVTPGPAILVIPAGLAILGTEFRWARRHVDRIRSELRRRSG